MLEEQFCQCLFLGGDVLYVYLDIWKLVVWMKEWILFGVIYYCVLISEESWIDSEVDLLCFGQFIYLWQFFKELLFKFYSYGCFIRWFNKEKGIFKIEDLVQVVWLWGICKNCFVMNYDKLSCFICQYYKKGIIWKLDIFQCFVYQFVYFI